MSLKRGLRKLKSFKWQCYFMADTRLFTRRSTENVQVGLVEWRVEVSVCLVAMQTWLCDSGYPVAAW